MALESKEEYLIPPELQEEWESYNDACIIRCDTKQKKILKDTMNSTP